MLRSAIYALVLTTVFVTAGCAQENLPPPVQTAVTDLAEHLNVPAAQVTVVHLEEVTWPDASLGCPEPGKVYAQVLIKGYKVTFEALGHRYEYHTDLTNRVVRVPREQMTPGVPTGPGPLTEPGEPEVLGTAIADLAARLGIDAAAVGVVEWEERQWPDGSLGLPEPGMMYTKAIVGGYYVVLSAIDREYEYHCSQTAAKLKGVRIAGDAVPTVLHMRRVEPLDGNNFFELVRMDPTAGGQTEVLFPFLSSYVATPDGKSLAVIVRTSRSGHDLLIPQAEGEPVAVDKAFGFGAAAWSPLGHKLAYWKRPTIMDQGRMLEVYDAAAGTRHSITLNLEGDWSLGGLAWTLDGLAFTVSVEGQGPRVMFWDGAAVREVARGRWVLGRIPQTDCIFAARTTGEDRVALESLRPTGEGEPFGMLEARDVLSVSAIGGQSASLCVIKGDDGKLKLVRVDWDGGVEDLMAVPGEDTARVAVGPTGGIVTLGYVGPEDWEIEVLRLDRELMPLFKLEKCMVALPVVR